MQEYTIKKLFIPFCFFQFTFVIFSNFFYINVKDPNFFIPNAVSIIALYAFSTYFVINEIRQLVDEGLGYLLSFWNYIDLIPPFGLYVMLTLVVAEEYVGYEPNK